MLYLFTGLALGLFAVGVALLLWQVRDGQLDDLDTPALRMLADDALASDPATPSTAMPTVPASIAPHGGAHAP